MLISVSKPNTSSSLIHTHTYTLKGEPNRIYVCGWSANGEFGAALDVDGKKGIRRKKRIRNWSKLHRYRAGLDWATNWRQCQYDSILICICSEEFPFGKTNGTKIVHRICWRSLFEGVFACCMLTTGYTVRKCACPEFNVVIFWCVKFYYPFYFLKIYVANCANWMQMKMKMSNGRQPRREHREGDL